MAELPTYEQMAKVVADKALDEFLYDGKSIREWTKIIVEQESSKAKLKSRMCDDYCKWPTEWQGNGELAESDICKNCPLNYL